MPRKPITEDESKLHQGEKRDLIINRLDEIASRNGGRLRPEDVVADAKDEQSPLHDQFTWDDKRAAHKRRLDEARTLIHSVDYVIRTERYVIECPVYVRDPACAPKEQGYIAVARVRNNEDAAREVLVEEFTRVAGFLRRARELAKALNLDHEVDRLLSGVLDLRATVREDRPRMQ